MAFKNAQDCARHILTTSNKQAEIEAEIATCLNAQGGAANGAQLQMATIDAMGQSSLIVADNMPSLASDIIAGQSERMARYGKNAYSLSEKQVAVIARAFADMRARRLVLNGKYDAE